MTDLAHRRWHLRTALWHLRRSRGQLAWRHLRAVWRCYCTAYQSEVPDLEADAMTDHITELPYDDETDDDLDRDCTWCAGDGYTDTDDPLWDGFGVIVPCSACQGTGSSKYQTIF